jgi:hypothetical protein
MLDKNINKNINKNIKMGLRKDKNITPMITLNAFIKDVGSANIYQKPAKTNFEDTNKKELVSISIKNLLMIYIVIAILLYLFIVLFGKYVIGAISQSGFLQF